MSNITDSYGRDLDLNLLRVFAVVAEEGSLTRAASRLYVTQPAISASLRRLSSFVGAELFTRQGHGLVLTSRGQELLAAAHSHLRPLVAAAMTLPAFEPAVSSATVRVGLADCLEAVLLPQLLARLREQAPQMRLVVLSAQFRTVEEMLLSRRVDLAVTVADDLPRSIMRRIIGPRDAAAHGFVCLFDPRFAKVPQSFTEREYFKQAHVAVSYAGDVRGIVEDALGKARNVRVAVPAFGHVPEVVDGSNLIATVPYMFALHVLKTRPHLRLVRVPFALENANLELLWSRVTDNDAPSRFVRNAVEEVAASLGDGVHAESENMRRPRAPRRGARRQA
ncbi:MAG: LysR family transcriptional regulator [Myxococcaceae bacterium]|nr:LysR family transcriptional regulator [Myxococcaceae bacterium]